MEWVKIIVTVSLACFGWWLVNYFNAKRDRDNKRRDLVIQHKASVFLALTQEIGGRKTTSDRLTLLENLISEIQLYGSLEQITLARKIADEICGENNNAKLGEMVANLRDDIRMELKIEPICMDVFWFRANKLHDLIENPPPSEPMPDGES